MQFTKEQLIAQAQENVDQWRDAMQHNVNTEYAAIRLRLAEIALAALTEPRQEPVAWRYRYVHTPKSEEHGSYFTTDWVITHSEDECNPSDCFERQPLYASPPALVVPDGYALVPIIPTEDMIINGFEAELREEFRDPEALETYEKMSGCELAAHRTKLCWAAMIAAAPQQERKT